MFNYSSEKAITKLRGKEFGNTFYAIFTISKQYKKIVFKLETFSKWFMRSRNRTTTRRDRFEY